MAGETYSLAVTGVRADHYNSTLEQVSIPDANASAGAMQNAMMTGAQFLCKNPSGSFSWYTYDAERSTPSVPILKRVS